MTSMTSSMHASVASDPVDAIAPSRAGREYWRSLDQLAETPEFKQFVEREFPNHASEMLSPFTRRTFLNLMAASVALAGGMGCRRPEQTIMPYSKMPENMVHGIPQHYATTVTSGAQTLGVVARCFEGRPVKLEGNPDFPSNLGALDAISQALILELYDPDRAQGFKSKGQPSKREVFTAAAAEIMAPHRANGGAGLFFLAERTTSPTLLAMRQQVQAALPSASWHVWDPINEDHALAGTALAFGRPLVAEYDLERADIVLALDSDLLTSGPQAVLNQKRFARRRRTEAGAEMNRLYVVESMLTLTGGMADHRLRMPADQIAFFLAALSAQLDAGTPAPAGALGPQASKWVESIARDILAHNGRVVIVAGESQPAEVHALALALTQQYGAECLRLHEPADAKQAVAGASLAALQQALAAGRVQTLVMLGGNPVYDAPADFKFGELVAKVPHSIHLTLFENETSKACEWIVPAAHQLESWGDVRAIDGTVGLQQPLISPLFGGLTASELLSMLTEQQPRRAYDIVFGHYRGTQAEDAYLPTWRQMLHDGLVPTTSTAVSASANIGAVASAIGQLSAGEPLSAQNLALQFVEDPQVYDGRYANNGWLQEAPHPVTKVTWDNAALVSHTTAKELGLSNDDIVRLELEGATAELPVLIVPSLADYVVFVQLGYGRSASGRIGTGVGTNVYPLRRAAAPWFARGLKLTRTSRTYLLSNVQDHHVLDPSLVNNRPLVLEATAAEYKQLGRGVVDRARFSALEKGPHATHGTGAHDEHGQPVEGHGSAAPEVASHGNLGKIHPPEAPNGFPAHENVATTHTAPAPVVPGRPDTAVMHRFEKAEIYTTDGASGATPQQKQYNISLFNEHSYANGNQWGMSIDLSACTGCQACMVACQAENNIPIVGKEQVRRNREMHWIRLDRYFVTTSAEESAIDEAEMVHQPMACQHCENAPCEQVCPVTATTHSPDGINEMTYNRCIGTRYCSNNCPFKVRRFNFLNYHEGHGYDGGNLELVKMASNPNVTVRMRGVMEKCTFCVQRVRRATADAKVAGRELVDGDVKSACQQTCPSDAIVFGDINDAKSLVTRAKTQDRNYELLSWMNIKPRVSYLARLRNPNPELLA